MWDQGSMQIARDFLKDIPLGQDFLDAVTKSKTVIAASVYEEIALIFWVDNQSEKEPGWIIAGAITSFEGMIKTIAANEENRLTLLRWKNGKVENYSNGLWIPAEYTQQAFVDLFLVMLEIRADAQTDLLGQIIGRLNT